MAEVFEWRIIEMDDYYNGGGNWVSYINFGINCTPEFAATVTVSEDYVSIINNGAFRAYTHGADVDLKYHEYCSWCRYASDFEDTVANHGLREIIGAAIARYEYHVSVMNALRNGVKLTEVQEWQAASPAATNKNEVI